jgi:RNA polymerase sigma-70 factor (ECF subfamily)
MIRITTLSHQESAVELVIEGQITKGASAEILGLCSEHLAEGRELALDLSRVTFADRAGAHLVRELIAKGCAVKQCSGFLRELIGDCAGQGPIDTGESDEEESQLVRRLRDRDPEALDAAVRRFAGRLLATARRLVGSEHDARDAVQEAFISAFGAIDSFDGRAKLSTWLHRIVVNAALMQLRHRRRHPEEPIENHLPQFSRDGQWIGEPPQWDEAAENRLQRRDSAAMVRRCIDALPVNHRSVLLLRDIEDLPTEETACALGITANAVKVRLHRARQALKTLIERDLRLSNQKTVQAHQDLSA